MAQNFVDKVGPVVSAAFLNGLDVTVNSVLAGATTPATARTALTTDLPLEVVNGGTGSRTIAQLASSLSPQFTPLSSAEIVAGVTPVNFLFAVGIVDRYGVNTTPGVTDMTAAIQTAVNVAQVQGGSVYFRPGYKYAMSAQVTVSSKFPVNLIGEMSSNPNETINATYIKPLNNITGSLFKYVSPTTTISEGGAGVIRGLNFMDDSNQAASTPLQRRNFTMTAALNLDSFSLGVVQNCTFNYILGSAILCGYVIQSKFDTLTFHYCGNTGQATIQMQSAGVYQTQNTTFSGIVSEVNFLAPHIALAANSNDLKFVNCGFETTGTVSEAFPYIQFNGIRNMASNCTFNRLPANAFAIDFTNAGRCVCANSVFDVDVGRCVNFSNDRNTVANCYMTAQPSLSSPIQWAATRCTLIGTYLYFTSGFTISGVGNKVIGCTFDNTNGNAQAYALIIGGSASGYVIVGNTITLGTNVGGLNLQSFGTVTGNTLDGFGSTSNGIILNSNNIVCTDNFIFNYTTALNPNGLLANCTVENNFGFVRRLSSSSGSVSDGGTISHGLSGTPTSIQVTGTFASNVYAVTAVTSTNFTVAIKNLSGASGTTQTIYWTAAL